MEHRENGLFGLCAGKLEAFKNKLSRKHTGTLLVAMGLVGMLLISMPGFLSEKATTEPLQVIEQEQDYAKDLSSRLEEVLGKIDGVGKIKVLVTLRQDSSYVYATDTAQNDQQEDQSVHTQTEEKHVIVEQNGEEQALVSTRMAPQVEGVIIVCEGGNDPVVVGKLNEAVTAALGIGSNRVAVSNMGLTE